jgi:putative heme iron utilization protein
VIHLFITVRLPIPQFDNMKSDILDEIKEILSTERVLALGVLRDGEPYVGLLPFVPAVDFASVVVHASRLALHTAGLEDEAPFSVLIHDGDVADGDPLQIRRITLLGKVEHLARDSRDYAVERSRYVDRFPASAPTFGLGDFSLYRLRFESGRFVGGFARARSLGPKDIEALGSTSAGA